MKCSKYRFPTITVTKLRFWILKLVTRFVSLSQMETKSTVKFSDVNRLIFNAFWVWNQSQIPMSILASSEA